jgi:hypothetical protein
MQYENPPARLKDSQILAAKRGEIDWRSLVVDSDDDLISSPSTAPGRPRTFLQSPHLGTSPFSCELVCYDNVLYRGLLLPLSRFLRCGAGVKVNLDNYLERPRAKDGFDWRFNLSPKHPDYDKISAEQREYLVSDRDYEVKGIFHDRIEQVIWVGDTMSGIPEHGDYSIEDSWELMIECAKKGIPVTTNLSYLRPHGQVNNRGLMASGPIGLGKYESDTEEACSFFSIYQQLAQYLKIPSLGNLLILMGTINDTLRRGGFKRGIVTTGMDWRNPFFEEYLDVPLHTLPGGHKKAARITPEIIEPKNVAILQKLVTKRNEESVFLAKVKPDFFDNVCMGLGIVNYGTCLIWRFNLGKIENMCAIPKWMERVAAQLTLLHLNWRKERPEIANLVAPQALDLQIGLDIMGLANALSYWGITYEDFNNALVDYLNFFKGNRCSLYMPINCFTENLSSGYNEARILLYWLAEGYRKSAAECDRICDLYLSPRFKRIHTASEPAQSHSYETTDRGGYATCRAIFPPFGKRTRTGVKVRRVSDHQKNVRVNHGFVESAAEVGPQLHQEVCFNFNAFVKMFGRSHEYMSFDDFQPMTEERFVDFVKDPRIDSFYYAEHNNYAQAYLSKSAPSLCSLKPSASRGECAVCAE